MEFLNKVKNLNRGAYNQFLEVMHGLKSKSITAEDAIVSVQILFKDHPDLIQGFNMFLPEEYQIRTYQPDPEVQRVVVPPVQASPSMVMPGNDVPNYSDAANFVNAVKSRFSDKSHIFTTFHQLLRKFHTEGQDPDKIYDQISLLFQAHPDLLAKFREFMPRDKPSRSNLVLSLPIERVRASFSDYEKFYMIKVFLGDTAQDFMKLMALYCMDILYFEDFMSMAKEYLQSNYILWNWLQEFTNAINVLSFEERNQLSRVKEITGKSSGASYKLIPKHYTPPICSGRTDLDRSVLNDKWKCILNEEVTYFEVEEKNRYERVLFKYEDKRYNWDLNIQWNVSLIQMLEDIKEEIQLLDSLDKKEAFKIDPMRFKTWHITILKKLYGEQSEILIHYLQETPSVTLPIVLSRLTQKDKEWNVKKKNQEQHWREKQELNFQLNRDFQPKKKKPPLPNTGVKRKPPSTEGMDKRKKKKRYQ
eukprot:TRINITY_DN6668_c0_g2_i1.p1 TRINITY_DN6668_c0_g2~~TRINITY_DN6668_c0_g2_i1.p1  ORF type:complete len:475 (-),score=83.10 TRINITY_DN6668_c0_g2_i1:36-1460(-)